MARAKRSASRTSGSSCTASPSARAASAMAANGMARGVSGWHRTTAATPAEASGAIMAEGSRPESMPTTATLVPSTANSSFSASPNVAMPAALCAPSTSSSGRRPSTSSRPGTRTAAKPSSTTSSVSGSPKKASTAARRHRRVDALVRPVQGDQDVLVAAARASTA